MTFEKTRAWRRSADLVPEWCHYGAFALTTFSFGFLVTSLVTWWIWSMLVVATLSGAVFVLTLVTVALTRLETRRWRDLLAELESRDPWGDDENDEDDDAEVTGVDS